MAVDSGMDVERVRSIAQQLLAQGSKIGDVATTGRSQLSVLDGSWRGPDLEQFSGQWGGAERAAQSASEAVRSFGERMVQQADDQQAASDGAGGQPGAGGPGGPGGAGGTPDGPGDGGFDLGDVAALGPLASGIAALATKGPRLFAALTGNGFKMYQGLMSSSRLAQVLGLSDEAIDLLHASTLPSKISPALGNLMRTVGPLAGKVLGPLGVITGGIDLVSGLMEGDYLRAAGGGLGMLSGGLATAAAFGVALGPVGIGVMAVAGIAAAGIAVYQNWDAISGAVSDIGSGIAEGVGNVAEGIADGVGSVLSDPVGAIGGLFS